MEGSNGHMFRYPVGCGVPQGLVIGPILRNIGFDWLVLSGMKVMCYADDTLITARGAIYEAAMRLAEVGTSLVVDRIAC